MWRREHRGQPGKLAAFALLAVLIGLATRLLGDDAARPATEPDLIASASSPRLPPRAELTAEQYKAEADDLRAKYSESQDKWPAATVDQGVEFVELGKLPPPPYPENNPYSKEKAALGQQLFFDPRLSGSGQIACASCHDPDLAWADGRTVSFGHGRTQLRRNSPSVLFSAYATTLFWDGRAGTLEDQAQGPVVSHEEMNADPKAVEQRLNALPDYKSQFKAVFSVDTITLAYAAKAIATYERSLATFAGRSNFDRFLDGKPALLSDSAVRGLHLFRTTARCINCHNGPALSDNKFHDDGMSFYGRSMEDLGRYNVTNDPADVSKFRTPTLRNITRTRPYMHNGLLDLDGVIRAYNAGMPTLIRNKEQKDDPLFPTKDRLLKSLGLNATDRADLKAFLESLEEPPLRVRPPKLPAEVAANAGAH
jgi:cytochrome c peroxidase